MVVYIRAADLAARLETMAVRLRHRITVEEERSGEIAHEALAQQSSGSASARELRRMGHPFARRAPQTPVDPALINEQTGDYKTGWQQQPAEVEPDSVTVRVVNADPAARWMKGTRRMIERPIIAAVQERLRAQRSRRLRDAADEVLRGE